MNPPRVQPEDYIDFLIVTPKVASGRGRRRRAAQAREAGPRRDQMEDQHRGGVTPSGNAKRTVMNERPNLQPRGWLRLRQVLVWGMPLSGLLYLASLLLPAIAFGDPGKHASD